MSSKTVIQALKQLQQEIVDKKKSLRPLFEDGLAELFEKHKTVNSLEVSVNNHEFNDGDATSFSLHYEDMTVNFRDGVVLSPYDGDVGAPSREHNSVNKEFVKFFNEFDVDGFYETLYGDAYESLTFKCRGGKVVTS